MLFGHRVHVHDESTYYLETCSISIKYIDICKLLHNLLTALKFIFFLFGSTGTLNFTDNLAVWGREKDARRSNTQYPETEFLFKLQVLRKVFINSATCIILHIPRFVVDLSTRNDSAIVGSILLKDCVLDSLKPSKLLS